MDLIKSIWEITFVPTTGSSVTLLAFGDYLTAEPDIKCAQQTSDSQAILVAFGGSYALGGLQTTIAWQRVRTSLEDPRGQALFDAANYPWGVQGRFFMSIQDGRCFSYEKAVMVSMSPSYQLPANRLLTAYTAKLGKPRYPVFASLVNYTGASGVAYSVTYTASTQFSSAATLSVFSGTLPTGIALGTGGNLGKLVGTPTTPGTYEFTLKIALASGEINLQAYTFTIT
jgi:hypothetical protein